MGLDFSNELWVAIALTIFAAGLSQGAMGFGFPAISTPILALMTDIKTAVLLNLLPNMTVNIISVVQGGNWRASLGVHWPLAVYALIGSFIGASVLIGGLPAAVSRCSSCHPKSRTPFSAPVATRHMQKR